MSIIATQNPIGQYFDLDGTPLDAGYLYFGQPSQNPETTPVVVYWDAAGTIPALQPIRTLNGYPVRSGKPAIIYASGNYSMTVRDKRHRLVLYAADSLDFSNTSSILAQLIAPSGAGLVGFDDSLAYPVGTIGYFLKNLSSDDVLFLLNAVGAIAIETSVVLSSRVLLSSFPGIDPTGVADSTVGINLALTATRGATPQTGKELHFGPGNYKVSGKLTIGSNQLITGTPMTVITVTGTALGVNTPLFEAANQDNVRIYGYGMRVIGNRFALEAAGATDEGNNCGFFFYGTTNFTIRDLKIFDFWTDCMSFDGDNTGSGPCENGIISNVFANNSRRNCASVISAKNLLIQGGQYTNAGGGAGNPGGPWAGIDFEPNQNCFLENVVVRDIQTYNNKGGGLVFAPGQLAVSGSASDTFQVTVDGWHSYRDGLADTNNIAALLFIVGNTTLGTLNKKLRGLVTVSNFVIDSPFGKGVAPYNWDADFLVQVNLENGHVYDPNLSGDPASNVNKAGFAFFADSGQTTTLTIGNFRLVNCHAEDRRGVPQMTWGFVAAADATHKLKNIQFIDCTSTNFVALAKSHVNTQAALTTGGMQNVSVSYTTPQILNISGTLDISIYAGMRLRSTGGGDSFTLPQAANCPGLAFEVVTASSSIACTVNRAGADQIVLNGTAAVSATVNPGAAIRFNASSASDPRFQAAYVA